MQSFSNQRKGGFRILGELQAGVGSQGIVYRAVCENATIPSVSAGQIVALKVIRLQSDDDAQGRRLRVHTSRLLQISHPHIVRYLGYFSERSAFNEDHIIVEEFLEGMSLKERLASSPCGLDADEAISIADAMLSGLEYAAEQGIVHRDVKPGNVFLCSNGDVKLVDFEVAKVEMAGESLSVGDNIKGSFDYLSPDFLDENFRGDFQSDIYSVGIVLHEMLCGQLPFPRIEGDGRQAGFIYLSRWEQLAKGKSPICVNPRISRLLQHADDIFAKALAIHREDRYANFSDFRNGLRSIRFRELKHGNQTYRLLRFIGRGGFGEVYKASHRETGKEVAVKRLLKMDFARRFNREARIMQQLRDPCFVQYFDFFVQGRGASAEAFLVMAYLDGMPGSSLRDAIKSSKTGGLPMRDVFTAFSRYAHGLALMHQQKLFHRDIKPSNLYYPKGKPSLAAIMDLGIARDENGTVTRGQVPGTLDYMPPEVVVSDNRGDERMDIYALGLCLYEALTGKLGYPRLSSGSAGLQELFERSRMRRLPDFSDPIVANDSQLLRLLREMTDPNVERRLNDAEEIAKRLATFFSGGPLFRTRPKSSSTTFLRKEVGVSRQEFRRSAVSYMDWHRLWRRCLNWGVAAISLTALGVACYWAYPAVKLEVARRQLVTVYAAYREGTWEAGAHAEREWLTRWRPQGGSWLELPYPSFIDFTNDLGAVKAEVQVRIEKEKRQAELDRERQDSIDRLGACRRIDGRLDERHYQSIAGWQLPARLETDAEVERILSGIGRVVSTAVRTKLELEPLDDRRLRIQMAKALISNPWTGRVMDDAQLKRLEDEIQTAETCVAGVVGNLCDEPICVDGDEIAPGGTQNLVIRDGKIASISIVRRGYRPIGLPELFDGTVFQVRNSMFVALPIRAKVPAPGGGITCKIDGVESSDSIVELLPGPHICVYSRVGYKDQRTRFVVRTNMPIEFPTIDEWQPKPLIRTEESKPAMRPVQQKVREWPEINNCGMENLDPMSMLRRSVRQQCVAKLVDEPVETRQERLYEAGTLLTHAVAIDHSLTEEDAKPLYAAIEARQKWVVGKVVNETSDELIVGGRKVAGGQTVLLRFENGLPDPDKWVVERAGYLPKLLMRDFDGIVLHFRDEDFVGQNVLVLVPKVARDISFVLGGETKTEKFYLKPGSYTGFYRRNGFRDQVISFEVPVGVEFFKLAAPIEGQWKSW